MSLIHKTHEKQRKVARRKGVSPHPDDGLYLAVSHATDVRDPVARAASVWARIRDTTAAHWDVPTQAKPSPSAWLERSAAVRLRTPVWFAY